MGFLRIHLSRPIVILVLVALGAGLCGLLLPIEIRAVEQQFLGFPDSNVASHQARPWVLAALFFLPALTAIIYSFWGALDRYVFRQFLTIFVICLCTLFMIWLLIDLTDNIGEFTNSGNFIQTAGIYYLTRLPAILVLFLPYSMLLALLYALGRLSANREIIAMIQAGRGVWRVTLPLLAAGIMCVLLSLGLNYHWAPVAEGDAENLLNQARGKKATEASQVLFRNQEKRRLWMIGEFPPDYQNGKALVHVEVTTTDSQQMLVSRLSAERAWWDRTNRQWTFDGAVLGIYSPDNPPDFQKFDKPLVIHSWAETPWQLIKPGLSPQNLGIPDLSTWLNANGTLNGGADSSPYLTHWHYRWALPFTCLVTVLLAAPLGIYFSRRGPGGGVFLSVVLSAAMLLVSTVIIAFGEAGMMRPALAAWLPNIIFTLLGAYLFHLRVTGRPIYHTIRKLLPNDS